MKGRAFAAVVLTGLLLLFGLGAGGWWLLWQRGPLQLAHQPLPLPRAARFVPAAASFSLYLFSDGQRPVDYARAVAPARERRRAAEAMARLRDGAFATAGLDYGGELAGWLGSEMAVALFEDPVAAATGAGPDQPARGWLLALASRDDDGARRFLQRFWQTRSLAGTDLQVSRYRGMGLISGRGALVGSRTVPLATALVDDDLVLIASGRNLLERALDVSQIGELNQAGQPQLRDGLASFSRGAALLVAAPEALRGWLGLPADAPIADDAVALLAALQPEGRTLAVQARLALRQTPALKPLAQEPAAALLEGLGGAPASLALLQDPAALLQQPLLRPLLARSLGQSPPALVERQGPLPSLLAQTIHGPLLASQGQDGWLLASQEAEPQAGDLDPLLAQAGLLEAPLAVEGHSLRVWTRLLPPGAGGRRGERRGEGDQLQAPLAGWREARGPLAWWGQSLAQLEAPADGRDLQALRRRLQDLQAPVAPLRWALDGDGARALLRSWQPWRLLSALAGGGLDAPVQGLALALEGDGEAPVLQVRARLSLGP